MKNINKRVYLLKSTVYYQICSRLQIVDRCDKCVGWTFLILTHQPFEAWKVHEINMKYHNTNVILVILKKTIFESINVNHRPLISNVSPTASSVRRNVTKWAKKKYSFLSVNKVYKITIVISPGQSISTSTLA